MPGAIRRLLIILGLSTIAVSNGYGQGSSLQNGFLIVPVKMAGNPVYDQSSDRDIAINGITLQPERENVYLDVFLRKQGDKASLSALTQDSVYFLGGISFYPSDNGLPVNAAFPAENNLEKLFWKPGDLLEIVFKLVQLRSEEADLSEYRISVDGVELIEG